MSDSDRYRPGSKASDVSKRSRSRRPSQNGSRNGSRRPSQNGSRNGSRRPSQNGSRNGGRRPSHNGSRNGSRRPSQNGSRNGSRRPSQNGSRRPSQNGSRRPSQNRSGSAKSSYNPYGSPKSRSGFSSSEISGSRYPLVSKLSTITGVSPMSSFRDAPPSPSSYVDGPPPMVYTTRPHTMVPQIMGPAPAFPISPMDFEKEPEWEPEGVAVDMNGRPLQPEAGTFWPSQAWRQSAAMFRQSTGFMRRSVLRDRLPAGTCGPGGKCCTCCSTKVIIFSILFTVLTLSTVVGVLFFRVPEFEPRLDSLEDLQFNVENEVNLFGISIPTKMSVQGSFEMDFINNNFLDVGIEELTAYIEIADIQISIVLEGEDNLIPAKGSVLYTASVDAPDISIGDAFDVLGKILDECNNNGNKMGVTLQADVTGTYLGVEAQQQIEPTLIFFDCPIVIG